MMRKEAELCLVVHLQEAYQGQDVLGYAQVVRKFFAAIREPFRLDTTTSWNERILLSNGASDTPRPCVRFR